MMRLRFHTLKAATATLVSLWMAAMACFLGCALPVLANTDSPYASTAQVDAPDAASSEPMMGMENCPHHSGGNPAKTPNDGKSAPTSGMSCCPLEATVASKLKTEPIHVAPAVLLLSSDLNFTISRFYDSVELVPLLGNSGRDTLLKTQLLRI